MEGVAGIPPIFMAGRARRSAERFLVDLFDVPETTPFPPKRRKTLGDVSGLICTMGINLQFELLLFGLSQPEAHFRGVR